MSLLEDIDGWDGTIRVCAQYKKKCFVIIPVTWLYRQTYFRFTQVTCSDYNHSLSRYNGMSKCWTRKCVPFLWQCFRLLDANNLQKAQQLKSGLRFSSNMSIALLEMCLETVLSPELCYFIFYPNTVRPLPCHLQTRPGWPAPPDLPQSPLLDWRWHCLF